MAHSHISLICQGSPSTGGLVHVTGEADGLETRCPMTCGCPIQPCPLAAEQAHGRQDSHLRHKTVNTEDKVTPQALGNFISKESSSRVGLSPRRQLHQGLRTQHRQQFKLVSLSVYQQWNVLSFISTESLSRVSLEGEQFHRVGVLCQMHTVRERYTVHS